MNIYLIKISNKENILKVQKEEVVTHSGIYNFENEISKNDIVFFVFGGDKTKIDWDQGLIGFGKIVTEPYDKGYDIKKSKNFKIDIRPEFVLDNPLSPKFTKLHPKYQNDLFYVPYVGANHFPTQAIAQASGKGALALFNLMEESNPKSIVGLDIKELTVKNGANIIISDNQTAFDYNNMITDLSLSGLNIDIIFIKRFVASLLSKPFVLLTGLSGSGKTKLALFLASWITNSHIITKGNIFKEGEILESSRVKYKIKNLNIFSLVLEQVETKVKAAFPLELIYEWVDIIKENDFDNKTNVRIIRDTVGDNTKYSTQLNSFESHLKLLAFTIIERQSLINNDVIKINQKCIISIGADWTNREPLIGYPNALISGEYIKPDNSALDLILDANDNPHYPFFLILDEMNLSHVERYFADFLSTMESEDYIQLHSGSTEMKSQDGRSIPDKVKLSKNIFIIGTVNVDETTYMFSPKVLDRASVLEFKVDKDELSSFLDNPMKIDLELITGKGSNMAQDFVNIAKKSITVFTDNEKLKVELLKFFGELKKIGSEFGYRTASEIFQYAGKIKEIESQVENIKENEKWELDQIVDTAIVQKLLPKLHGSRNKLEKVLIALGKCCLVDSNNESFLFEKNGADKFLVKYPISYEKLCRMYNSVIKDGFTSFAEA